MYKVVSLILLTFTYISSSANTVEYDSLFTTANQFYAENHFEKAYQIYDGLIQENISSYNLFFNYANACLKTNRAAKAIAYYKKSLRIQPASTEAQKNLNYTLQLLEVNEINHVVWIDKWNEETFYVITVVLIFTLLILYLLKRQGVFRVTKLYKGVFILLTLCFIFFITISAIRFNNQHLKTFAVSQKETVVYQEPFYLSKEVYELNEGQTVQVLDTHNGWSKIVIGKYKEAWIPSDFMIEI
ncbi:MAG: hypothetical protein M9887_05990 [Chitinophagales bacterium]|nr:hypothetical protein [Chitinophagales bacterium]